MDEYTEILPCDEIAVSDTFQEESYQFIESK
jgi:hypothetical protein